MIELIGILELLLVVEMFMFEGEDGCSFGEVVWFDMMVMVVDVFNFLCDYVLCDSL